jgi:hypothetical protein
MNPEVHFEAGTINHVEKVLDVVFPSADQSQEEMEPVKEPPNSPTLPFSYRASWPFLPIIFCLNKVETPLSWMARSRVGASFAVLLAFACLGSPGLAQISAESAAGNAPSNAPANTDKTTIADPTMRGMEAFEVTYPAKWRFKGGMYLSGEGGYIGLLIRHQPTPAL